MRAEQINPFVEAAFNVFQTMLDTELTRAALKVGRAHDAARTRHIAADIDLKGAAEGLVTLVFPRATALAICTAMTGQEVKVVDENVRDALGEVVNMIAGSAKAKFVGQDIDLGLPRVGRLGVRPPAKSGQQVTLTVPFSGELGPFDMDVTFALNRGQSGTPRAAVG